MQTTPFAALLALPMLFACASTEAPAPPPPPSPEAIMEAMTRAGTPVAEHRMLDAFVGRWNAEVTTWMDPSAPPSVSTGRMDNTWMLDGRYLEQRFNGAFEGQTFEGRGMFGYDVAAGKFIGTWMDSMSTSVGIALGSTSDGGRTFTLALESTDPLSGARIQGEEVITVDGPDKHTFTMYDLSSGSRVKQMEIVYTRLR